MGPLRARPAAAVLGAILIGTVGVALLDSAGTASDVQLFAAAASHGLHAYGDPEIQAGPVELALVGAAHALGHGQDGFAILLDVFCTAALALVALLLLEGKASRLALFGAGASALWLPGAAYNGHPAEPLIAALWLLAAREARRGRATLAGGVVGVSACCELWGLLGVAVLALAPRVSLRGAALAGALPAVALAPFAATGDFRMFSFQWPVTHGLPLLLLGPGAHFTWPLRVAEAAVVLAAGAGVARATRGWRESVWLVPATVALVRMACDPVAYGYYWATPLAVLLVGAVGLLSRRGELAARLTPDDDRRVAAVDHARH